MVEVADTMNRQQTPNLKMVGNKSVMKYISHRAWKMWAHTFNPRDHLQASYNLDSELKSEYARRNHRDLK